MIVKMGVINVDVGWYPKSRPIYPYHLKDAVWAFKPAAPLVLDIKNIALLSSHKTAEENSYASWLKEHNVKKLNKSNTFYSTYLFPNQETKVLWLLQADSLL